MPKPQKQIEAIVAEWWTGMDAEGEPLALWQSLDRNHYRPDLEHLRAMLTKAGVADYSIGVDLTGTTPEDSHVVITLRDHAPRTVTGEEVDPYARVKGKAEPPAPPAPSPPVVVTWTPPAASEADRRSVMDIRWNGITHARRQRMRAETIASRERAAEQAAVAERLAASKTDRTLRAPPEES